MLRRARIIILLLFLGAILNIAVAWGISYAHGEVTQDWSPFHNPREDPLVMMVTKRFGYEIVSGVARSGTLLDRHSDKVQNYGWNVWWPVEATEVIPSNYAIASGWPMLSLSTLREVIVTNNPDNDWLDYTVVIHYGLLQNAYSNEQLLQHNQTVPVIFPFHPIFPGFLINTLFYALVLWLLFCGPGKVRRFMRKRRGRCPKCGYPIGESPQCTECGVNVAQWNNHRKEITADARR